MSVPREPFSWDDEDRPVPLGAPTPEDPGLASPPQILSDAETVVLEAQEAIGRQDTDPAISIPPTRARSCLTSPSEPTAPRSFRISDPRLRKSLVAVLVIGCVLSFAHGWSAGARAGERSDGSCDHHHCHTDPVGNEWKEERRP
jgi:hypothetical protein